MDADFAGSERQKTKNVETDYFDTSKTVAVVIATILKFIQNNIPEVDDSTKTIEVNSESELKRVDWIINAFMKILDDGTYPMDIYSEGVNFWSNKINFTIETPKLSNFIEFLVTHIYKDLDQDKILEIIKFAIEKSNNFQILGSEIKLSLQDRTLFGLVKNPEVLGVLKGLLLSKNIYKKDFKKVKPYNGEPIKLVESHHFNKENGFYQIVVPDLIQIISKLLQITGNLDLAENKAKILKVIANIQGLIKEEKLNFSYVNNDLVIEVNEEELKKLTDLLKLDKNLILALAYAERLRTFGSRLIIEPILDTPILSKINTRLRTQFQETANEPNFKETLTSFNSLTLPRISKIIGVEYKTLLWLLETAKHLEMEPILRLLIAAKLKE